MATVFVLGLLGFFFPAPFAACKDAIPALLGLVMLGMGLTLTPGDFRGVLERPGLVVLGALLQFFVMPAAAWAASALLGLSPEAAVGMVLVGASPGGTASNVICYLAGADVALSVTLTAVSTLLSPLVTPALTRLYAGQWVDVNALGLFWSVVKIVLGPVLAGLLLRRALGGRVRKILPALVPFTSVAIALIIAIIVGATRPILGAAIVPILPAVILHNAVGLSAGYSLARLFRCRAQVARTLAIEVGMQNSGLAVALAGQFFGAAAALPGALFSVWHNVSGALLAGYWQSRPVREDEI